MNNTEKEKIASELPLQLSLISEITQQSSNALLESVKKIKETTNPNPDEGVGLLRLKNLLMLEYLTNLTHLIYRKCDGKSIAGDESVDRIVENRIYLEKIRPIERKIKYQVEKAVKAAENGALDKDDPIRLKPNPDALVDKLQDQDDDDDDVDDLESNKSKKYVVPKHVPAFFDDGNHDNDENDEEKEKTRSRKQLLSRRMIEELKEQHLDTPEEVFEREDVSKKKAVEAVRERIRYEEDNYMRLPAKSKKEKAKMRKARSVSTVGSIGDEITSFAASSSSRSSKRKRSGNFSASKKRFKKK